MCEVDRAVRVPGGSVVRWNFKSCAVHAIHEGRIALCGFWQDRERTGMGQGHYCTKCGLETKTGGFWFLLPARSLSVHFRPHRTTFSGSAKQDGGQKKNVRIGSTARSALSKTGEQARHLLAFMRKQSRQSENLHPDINGVAAAARIWNRELTSTRKEARTLFIFPMSLLQDCWQ